MYRIFCQSAQHKIHSSAGCSLASSSKVSSMKHSEPLYRLLKGNVGSSRVDLELLSVWRNREVSHTQICVCIIRVDVCVHQLAAV